MPVRSFWSFQVALTAFAFAVLLNACAGNPVTIAETPAQKAYAIVASYNVLLDVAADVVADPERPLELRRALQDMEPRTTEVIESLEATWAAYEAARATWEQSRTETAAETLDVISENLEEWLGRGQFALAELAAAIRGD